MSKINLFDMEMFNLFLNCFQSSNEDSNGFYLPSEILSHIFSFLRVKDRKNVRLTCSQWYNACNTLSLIQSEKLVILPNYDEKKSWVDVLMDCPRLRFDIEFARLCQIPPDASVFWQKIGPRVKSVKLVSYMLNRDFYGPMMKFCNNLEKLHIREYAFMVDQNDDILNWEKLEIIHESLKWLVLEACPSLTDSNFSKLFDIYPCIQKLALIDTRVNCHKRIDMRFYSNTWEYNSTSILSFTCVFDKIKSKAENIRSLVFDGMSVGGLQKDWFEDFALLPALKLEELKLIEHPNLSENAFINFFSHQTNLEYIEISKCRSFTLKCFLHMIRNCSRLSTIKVECLDVSSNFSMSKEIFHALISLPNLKVLELNGMFFMEEFVNVNRVAPVSGTAFERLCELTLKMPTIYFDIFVPKIPPHLSALHLVTKCGENGLTDANLQLIFDKWVNLRSLHLCLDSTVSDFGFTGCRMKSETESENSGISIKRLKRLEDLILNANKSFCSITYDCFCHFVFPNLQKLELVRFPEITEEMFKLLCQNTPSMEKCVLEKCNIGDEDVIKFQGGWKGLRCCQVEMTATYLWLQ